MTIERNINNSKILLNPLGVDTEPLPGYPIFEGAEDYLEQFKGDTRYIIRYRDIDVLKKELNVTTEEEVVLEIEKMFNVLKQYGIEAPIGIRSGKKRVRGGVKEKLIIYTKRVERSDHDYPPADLEKLCKSLFEYYRDAFESHQRFLCDLSSLEQYVYGRTEKNEQDRFILIDTDPWVVQGLDEFVQEMHKLVSTLVVLAQKNVFVDYIEKWLSAFTQSIPQNETTGFLIEDLEEINNIRSTKKSN